MGTRRRSWLSSRLQACAATICGAFVLLLSFMAANALAASASGGATLPVSAMNGWSLGSLSDGAYDQQLAAMEAAGVKILRDDVPWQQIEPYAPGTSGPQYQWAEEDNLVSELASHHITLLPILDYSTTWGATIPGDWRSPPADDQQFAGYAQAVAARYGVNGTFWKQNPQLPYEPVQMFEVWNEENGGYFWDTGWDPAGYARLYLASRTAIRGVDPSASVIIGGLASGDAGTGWDFLQAMFQAVPGLKGQVDGVGYHPYQDDGAEVDSAVAGLRETLISLGEGDVPIEVTEFGWPTGTPEDESWRATQMSDVATTLARSNCGVTLIAPYDWYNPAGSGPDFGLSGGTSFRPAGTAWFDGLNTDLHLPSLTMCPAEPASSSAGTAPPATRPVSNRPTRPTRWGTLLAAVGRSEYTRAVRRSPSRRSVRRHARRRK